MPERTPLGRCATVLAAALVVPLLGGCSLFGDDDEAAGVSVFSIKPGQCFEGQTEVKAQQSELPEVECAEDHAQESYAVIEYQADSGDQAGDTYPGDDALAKFANGACAGEYGKYVGVDYLDSELFYTYLLPSARSWEDDDRSVICFVTSAGEPLQGSVKGSKR